MDKIQKKGHHRFKIGGGFVFYCVCIMMFYVGCFLDFVEHFLWKMRNGIIKVSFILYSLNGGLLRHRLLEGCCWVELRIDSNAINDLIF